MKYGIIAMALTFALLYGCAPPEPDAAASHAAAPPQSEDATPSTAPPQTEDATPSMAPPQSEDATPSTAPPQSEDATPSAETSRPKIVVKKAARKLILYDGETRVDTFKIGLGFTPKGAKQREGDGKTPEGLYYVCTRNPKSRYHCAFGVSYPNVADARKGLKSGLIDEETYERIASCIADRQCPPWDTPLGGAICIHGNGAKKDWTAGCIALDNDDMDVLWRLCPVGTEIEILP